MDDLDIKRAVRDRYAGHATSATSCCSPTPTRAGADACCGSTGASLSEQLGYDADELAGIPDGADLGLGCGNPLAMLELQAGETVVDLGSGAGPEGAAWVPAERRRPHPDPQWHERTGPGEGAGHVEGPGTRELPGRLSIGGTGSVGRPARRPAARRCPSWQISPARSIRPPLPVPRCSTPCAAGGFGWRQSVPSGSRS